MRRVLLGLLVAGLPSLGQAQDYDAIGIENLLGALRGHSECRANLELAFPVSGVIADLSMNEGQTVTAHDTLIRLDQRIEAIELDRRRVIAADQSDLNAAHARQSVAYAQWQSAKQLFDRGGAISREELQNRKLASDLAVVEVDRLIAQEKLEELDVQSAQAAFDRRTMSAPSDGIVSKILKNTGESVQAYEPVMVLCDVSQIIFVASLPAFGKNTVIKGDMVELHFSGQPVPVAGRVRFVSPVVDAASGLLEVKIDFVEQPPWMRQGLGALLVLSP